MPVKKVSLDISPSIPHDKRATRSVNMSKYLIAIFWIFLVLFNYPISSIFDRKELVMGVPVFVIYLFTAWLLMVLSLAIVFKSTSKRVS